MKQAPQGALNCEKQYHKQRLVRIEIVRSLPTGQEFNSTGLDSRSRQRMKELEAKQSHVTERLLAQNPGSDWRRFVRD